VVAAPASQIAGWEGEMELLGMVGGSSDRRVGLCTPTNVLYRARYVPFPPRFIGTILIKPLSTPFPLLPRHYLASPAHNPEDPWPLWLNVTIRAQRHLVLAPLPSAQLLPALPAQGKVRPPLPISSLCLCLWIHGAIFFSVCFSSAVFLGFQC